MGDHTFHLANEFIRQGHEVSVLCRKDKRIIEAFNLKNSSIRVLPCIEKWGGASVKIIKNIVDKLQPNWVIIQYTPYSFHHYGLPFFLLNLAYSFRNKVNLAIFFHEVRIKIFHKNMKRILNALPMIFISKQLSKLAKLSLTSNEGYQRLLTTNPNNIKSHIIRIGSNIHVEDAIEKKSSKLLKKSLLEVDDFVIGTFGMGVRGLPVLLSVFKEISKSEKSITLVLIGNLKADIVKQIKNFGLQNELEEKIVLTGYLPSDKVASYISILDIYLMLEPSHSNNIWTGTSTRSGTLATAMGLGIPVIGTRGELTDGFFVHKKNIYLLDYLNEENLKLSILYLLEDSTMRKILSVEGSKSYQKELTWEISVKKITELFLINK